MDAIDLEAPFVPLSIDDRDAVAAAWARVGHLSELRRLEQQLAKTPDRPTLPSLTDFAQARRNNDRARTDTMMHAQSAGLEPLVLHRLLQGDGEDDKLLNWLFDLVHQPSWSAAAHLPDRDIPESDAIVIELGSTERAMMFAEIAESLGPWLEKRAPRLLRSMRREVERRIVRPFGEWAEVWWHPKQIGTRKINNWTGVCCGCILAAAISLERQGMPQPAARQRAIEGLRLFFDRAFTPDGECDEGVGYWNYGVEMACMGLSRLGRAEIAQALDLDRIKRIASYPSRVHLMDDLFHASNDSGPRAHGPALATTWLAALSGDAFLEAWGRRAPASLRGFSSTMRALRYVPQHDPDVALPRPPAGRLLKDQQIAIFQRRLDDGRVVSISLEGGNNAESHNHNDLGTIQIWSGTRAVVAELGLPVYTADFFTDKRYTYLVVNSDGHCCPTINGHVQRAGKDAQGTILGFSEQTGEFALDLTRAYLPEAKLRRWTRHLHAPAGQPAFVQLEDRFETDGAAEVVHHLWALEPIELDGPNRVIRFPGGDVRLDPWPAAIAVRAFDAQQINLRGAKPGQQVYRLDASYREPSGSLRVMTTVELIV